MAESPSTLNYYIGKGVVSFKKTGEVEFRDLGNVTVFEFTPALEQLDHFSSREGVKTKDRTVVLSKSATVHIIAEEWTMENLQMALLGGDIEVASDGRDVFDIFASNAVSGALKFVGTNEVGPRVEINLPSVDFIPNNAISPISEEWGVLDMQGNVNGVDGSFGTLKHLGEENSST